MKRENNKGITLIALAITIGVLIIISFISIASLTSDNGIIKQTNVAKIEKIEGDVREQVGIGLTTMNLAILEARARDNSFSAVANSGKIKAELIKTLNADKTGLVGEFTNAGVDEGDNATEIKIVYTGNDYQTACNNANAKIVYTLTLNQRAIELKGESSATLKDQNKNDVVVDVGGNISGNIETITKEQSYVGYYANIDEDPEPEGIIYADLAIEAIGESVISGIWLGTNATYSYSPIIGTKDYYISKKDYVGPFGKKDVISVVPNNIGEERFFVMSLEDIKKDSYTIFFWYRSAYSNNISDYSAKTSTDFKTGKSNTSNMINAWKVEDYGIQNTRDVWGVIEEKYADGWFMPSRGEWGAFCGNLGINASNYSSFGLANIYWSSSLQSSVKAYGTRFDRTFMDNYDFSTYANVRLSTTL